ncbi:MAG: hypothetical protein ACI8RZ_003460 [Myxococcota bacterium]|jgi:hypothetical protein
MFTFNLLYAVLIAAPAQAGGYSTDIELLQPGFSSGSVPGIDSSAQGSQRPAVDRWSGLPALSGLNMNPGSMLQRKIEE